jgi:hypothetical protein
MFGNSSDSLNTHLETQSAIKSRSLVVAEWNLNIPENIEKIGNYRYRPTISSPTQSNFGVVAQSYDHEDLLNAYTGATDSDTIVDGGTDADNSPVVFKSQNEKNKLLFSLEDCFGRFRPRSGINKSVFFSNRFIHYANSDMAKRPRYYVASKDDPFKYWTSFRTEENGTTVMDERGIGKTANSVDYIDDAVPFIKYKEKVPTNKIVVKMQTHVGSIDLGPFTEGQSVTSDPFYGSANKAVPKSWKIEYLDDANNWATLISGLDQDDVDVDGYVEVLYGITNIPSEYQNNFKIVGEYASENLLPEQSVVGYTYLVKLNSQDIGTFHTWTGTAYQNFIPNYGWYVGNENPIAANQYVTDFTSPQSFISGSGDKYREFQYINGLRLVVSSMNVLDSTFDLIELSPRLSANITDMVNDFSITKTLSDLGNSGMPVGQLLASVGDMEIFDFDQSFNSNNENSIISRFASKNLQVKFYEVVEEVNNYDYFVPIKTMYVDGFPETNGTDRTVSLSLRDMFFYFESMKAPEILTVNKSVSYIISQIFDSVGFSNYKFYRVAGESDPVIPYFFSAPGTTIAELLQDLAVSTQTAMFFDEYNDFVMMTKDYIMPTVEQRATNMVLKGSRDIYDRQGTASVESGILENETFASRLSNIVDISSVSNDIYNDGQINYTTRYVQRSYGSIKQASQLDFDHTWTYKPVLLWEVAPTETTKTINQQVANQEAYALTAIPLNSTLEAVVPTVSGGVVINNELNFGESVYWIARYNGYFYSNGETIKYDAVQYSTPGQQQANVWITSSSEYQEYFSKIPFNGKMYPTGKVRIYSEPYYNDNGTLKNGPVAKHGRQQFGTPLKTHEAGISSHWTSPSNIKSCWMNSSLLFKNSTLPATVIGISGKRTDNQQSNASVSGIIGNFLSSSYKNEDQLKNARSVTNGSIQSSALVFNGPNGFTDGVNPLDFVTYINKPMDNIYKHYGTRLRIIGRSASSENKSQSPTGSNPYFTVIRPDTNQSLNIGGSSGGISVMVDPDTNVGYYFEIIAMTETSVTAFNSDAPINNVLFYKVKRNTKAGTTNASQAIPELLWSGFAKILVDDGKFTGQARVNAEKDSTVYDLSVEYEDVGTTRVFYLYLNNVLFSKVVDTEPLVKTDKNNNVAPFVRGSSRLMFENLYAIANNPEISSVSNNKPVSQSITQHNSVSASSSFVKYGIPAAIQSAYISGVSSESTPEYIMYYDEFGTVMREAAYFNIKYDKAYPALKANISKTFGPNKGYVVSGFVANAYGAEFLVFNITDTVLNLDSTTGNYLRIQGVTFTQQSEHNLTVNEYFDRHSDFSQPSFSGDSLINVDAKKQYLDIKNSRSTYGNKSFTLDAPYIQDADEANKLMRWMVSKIMKPRKAVGVEIFPIPTLQLGDIVEIDYVNENGVNEVGLANSRFIVYSTEYAKTVDGPEMTVYLSEVI